MSVDIHVYGFLQSNELVAKLVGYDQISGDYKNQDCHIFTSPWTVMGCPKPFDGVVENEMLVLAEPEENVKLYNEFLGGPK